MLSRKERSAILVTSSMAAKRPMPGMTTYSASKSFCSFVAEGLSWEVQEKIDVIAFEPAGVSTKMLKKKAGGMVLSEEEAVVGALADLGHERRSSGGFVHDFMSFAGSYVPNWTISAMMFKAMKSAGLKMF